jgi:hypothetical protein
VEASFNCKLISSGYRGARETMVHVLPKILFLVALYLFFRFLRRQWFKKLAFMIRNEQNPSRKVFLQCMAVATIVLSFVVIAALILALH